MPLYQVNLQGRCDSVTAAGDYLIVGYGRTGVRLFQFPADASETTPVLKQVATVLRNRNRVKAADVGDKWLFTANEEMGIDMINLQNPAFPVLAGEFVPRGISGLSVQSVTFKDKLLFVPAWDAGVLVFRVSDGPAPPDFNLENLNAVSEK
jgi:hypothetical protein